MSTQNVYQFRCTFANLPAATYYCPLAVQDAGIVQSYFTPTTANAYVVMDGFDHLSIMFKLVAGVNDTMTLTVESDDGVTATFEWDETKGSYDSTTNSYNASYVAANATLRAHLNLDDCDGKLFHVKLIVAGGLSNSGILVFRRTKV